MTDTVAVVGIENRDTGLFNDLICQHSKNMWQIACAVLKAAGGEGDVEDCIAETFAALWEDPEQYDPQGGSLQDWLCTKARSKAMERYRVLSGSGTVPLDGPMMMGRMGMQDAALLEKNKRELSAAVASLSDTERDILIRRFYYEQNIKEIAIALNITPKDVQGQLHRSKQLLRKALSVG